MRNAQLPALTAIALVVSAAVPASAHLVGATYDFATSTTGSTAIGATPGIYTDPANPGFCVGPPVACASGEGLSGAFFFADVSPGSSIITFTFFGGTEGAGPGSFSIALSDFSTTDGEKITAISLSPTSGNLFPGDFSSVSWDGATATFTGSTATEYGAIGGRSVSFDVSMTAVPEPATWALMLMGFAGVGYAAYGRGAKGRRALT